MLNNLIDLASYLETAVGLSFILFPSLIINLLLGIESTLQENIIGRIGGISILCLAIACRKGKNLTNVFPAFTALLIFNFAVALYLYFVKFSLGFQGAILLPAAILHNIIGVSLLYVFFKKRLKS